MNDRLGDIPGWALEDDDDENEAPADGKKEGGDIEMGETTKQPKHMEHFFREVETIKQDIEAVQKASKQISEFNEAALQATTTEDENAISRKLRPLVDETNKRAKRTKTLLGLLKEENKKLLDQGKVKPTDLRYVSLDSTFEYLPYHPASNLLSVVCL
jgi:t-SNARE complex subunit (syntaxin)